MAKKNQTSPKGKKQSGPAQEEKEKLDFSGSGSSDEGIREDSREDDSVKKPREERDIELEAARGSGSSDEGIQEDGKGELAIQQLEVLLIIPYKASVAKADELRYALRAWDKFFPQAVILLVGDLPDWASDKVIYIPHTPVSANPQVDVAQKLLAACQSDQVPDYFFLSNDDIYPVAPVTISDVDIQKASGRLGVRGSANSLYRKNAARTLEALKTEGIKAPWDYATHTPVGVWKKELEDVITRFRAQEEGHLVTTLYFNTVWKGHRPVLVDTGEHPAHKGTQSYVASVFRQVHRSVVARAFAERKFINNNDSGWSSVEPFLKKAFPEKSRFEK